MDEDAIEINLFNNAFSKGGFDGDFSWQFDIDMNIAKNRDIFNHINLLAVRRQTPKFKVVLQRLTKTEDAELMLIDFKNNKISAYLKLNLNASDVLKKNIKDFSWYFGFNADLENNAEAYLNAAWPDKFCIPGIINETYYDTDDRPDFEGMLNRFNLDTNLFVRNYKTPTFDAMNINAMVPQPFLLWMLEVGFAEMGLKITGDFVKHPDVMRCFIYQNFEAVGGTDHNSYGYYTNAQQVNCNGVDIIEIDGGTGGRFNPVNNRYESQEKGVYKFVVYFTIDSITAQANVVDLIAKDNNGVSTKYRFYNAYNLPVGKYAVPLEVVLDNGGWCEFYMDSLNGTGVINISSLSISSIMKGSSIMNTFGVLAGFDAVGMPDISFGAFLNAVSQRFLLNVVPNFRANTVNISFAKDLPHLRPSKELKKVDEVFTRTLEKDKYVIINKDPKDDYLAQNYYEEFREKIVIEYDLVKSVLADAKVDDSTEIKLKLAPLLDSKLPPEGLYSCSQMDESGGSRMLNEENTPDLRFGFYNYAVGKLPISTCEIQTELGGFNDLRPFVDVVNWYEKLALANAMEIEFYLNGEEFLEFNIYEPYYFTGVIVHLTEVRFRKVGDYYIAVAKAVQY